MISGVKPLGLIRREDAFDDADWVFELKHDGFRALAYVDAARCWLVSRNQHRFDEFNALARAIAKVVADRRAVIDGEIVCLDADGRPQFYELLARKGKRYYYAFDLLWLDGEDLRDRPLLEGIIAKRKMGLYREGTTWYKIKNAAYSQAEGRGELFDRRRSRPGSAPEDG